MEEQTQPVEVVEETVAPEVTEEITEAPVEVVEPEVVA